MWVVGWIQYTGTAGGSMMLAVIAAYCGDAGGVVSVVPYMKQEGSPVASLEIL